MLKRVMFFLMAAYSLLRLLALAYTVAVQVERLPVLAYILSGATVVIGLFLVCKRILVGIRMRQVELYYFVTALTSAFNLIYVRFTSRIDATLVDFLVIGTVLDIVVSVTLLVMAEKERHYVRIAIDNRENGG